jgi:hypothetical protein
MHQMIASVSYSYNSHIPFTWCWSTGAAKLRAKQAVCCSRQHDRSWQTFASMIWCCNTSWKGKRESYVIPDWKREPLMFGEFRSGRDKNPVPEKSGIGMGGRPLSFRMHSQSTSQIYMTSPDPDIFYLTRSSIIQLRTSTGYPKFTKRFHRLPRTTYQNSRKVKFRVVIQPDFQTSSVRWTKKFKGIQFLHRCFCVIWRYGVKPKMSNRPVGKVKENIQSLILSPQYTFAFHVALSWIAVLPLWFDIYTPGRRAKPAIAIQPLLVAIPAHPGLYTVRL